MRSGVLLLLVAAVSLLPFFDYPEWRGTEARRVQIAAEMVATGDYVVPRLWGEETYAKPPFYYWILAGSFHLFGVQPWSARLPSVLGFWLLAFLGLRYLSRWHDRTTGWLAAVGLLASPIVMHDVPFAEIDPMFAVLTAWSMLCLADGVVGERRGALLWAGLLGGLAVLTKGPPYLMFCVGPLALWWRRNRCRGIGWFLPPVFLFYLVYKLVLDSVAPAADASEVAVEETVGRLQFWRLDSLLGIPKHLLFATVGIGLPFSFWIPTWFRTARRAAAPGWRCSNMLVLGAAGSIAVLVFSVDRSTRYLLPAVPMAVFGLSPVVAAAFADRSAPARLVRLGVAGSGVLAGVALLVLPWVPHPYPGTTWLALAGLGTVGLAAGSRAALARFAVVAPLLLAAPALTDREAYARSAADFVPPRAAVLARELERRGVRSLQTDGHVGTSVLLHAVEAMGGPLTIHGDFYQRRPETARHLLLVGRGDRGRQVPGYREELRLRLDRSKVLSLLVRL